MALSAGRKRPYGILWKTLKGPAKYGAMTVDGSQGSGLGWVLHEGGAALVRLTIAISDKEVAMQDPRVDSLLDEAQRLRLSRRSILRRGAAIGLSSAAVAGVLSATGRASAAPRAAAFIQQRQLNTLAATYFVPEGQEFFTKMAQDWG